MNDADAKTIIGLLGEILAELRKAPAARAPAASGAKKTDAHTGELIPPANASWASFEWPSFTRKKAREVTIGESARTEKGRSDLTWWAKNFVVKPYNGNIQRKDTDFRTALDEAMDWLASPSSSPEAAGAAPSRPAAPPDRSPQYNPGPADNDAPPF